MTDHWCPCPKAALWGRTLSFVVLGLLGLSLLLGSAACGPEAPPSPAAMPSPTSSHVQPSPTVTPVTLSTPKPVLPIETPSPTATPPATATPKPPATATAEPTKVATPTPPEVAPNDSLETIIGEGVHSSLAVEGVVDGYKVQSHWLITQGIYDYAPKDRPFDRWTLNVDYWGPKAADLVSQAVLKTHWYAYKHRVADIAFLEFVAKLKAGADMSYPIISSVPGSVLQKEQKKVDPSKPVFVVLDSKFKGIPWNEEAGLSSSLTVRNDGSLVVETYYRHDILEQDPVGAPVVAGRMLDGIATSLYFASFPDDYQYGTLGSVRLNQYLQEKGSENRDIYSTVAVKGARPALLIQEK